MPKSIPSRWKNYKPIGKRIEGTRFIAFKVPLKSHISKRVDNEIQLDGDILLKMIPNLGLIIDLTNTNRFYNPKIFQEAGIEHKKLMVKGHKTPRKDLSDKFISIVKEFLEKNKDNDNLIGVHCTHGVNRTGYMICNYMISEMTIEPNEAMNKFANARGHKIERVNYVDNLKNPKIITEEQKVTVEEKVEPKNWRERKVHNVQQENWRQQGQHYTENDHKEVPKKYTVSSDKCEEIYNSFQSYSRSNRSTGNYSSSRSLLSSAYHCRTRNSRSKSPSNRRKDNYSRSKSPLPPPNHCRDSDFHSKSPSNRRSSYSRSKSPSPRENHCSDSNLRSESPSKRRRGNCSRSKSPLPPPNHCRDSDFHSKSPSNRRRSYSRSKSSSPRENHCSDIDLRSKSPSKRRRGNYSRSNSPLPPPNHCRDRDFHSKSPSNRRRSYSRSKSPSPRENHCSDSNLRSKSPSKRRRGNYPRSKSSLPRVNHYRDSDLRSKSPLNRRSNYLRSKSPLPRPNHCRDNDFRSKAPSNRRRSNYPRSKSFLPCVNHYRDSDFRSKSPSNPNYILSPTEMHEEQLRYPKSVSNQTSSLRLDYYNKRPVSEKHHKRDLQGSHGYLRSGRYSELSFLRLNK